MMEKYGVEEHRTYEVVLANPARPDDLKIVAAGLTLSEANEIRIQTPNSFVRPEKSLLSE